MKVDYNFNLKERGIAMSKRGSGSSARAGNGVIAAFNAASLPIKGSEKQVA